MHFKTSSAIPNKFICSMLCDHFYGLAVKTCHWFIDVLFTGKTQKVSLKVSSRP